MSSAEPGPRGLQQAYTQGGRRIATQAMAGLADTRLTPNALTIAGVSLCLAGAVLFGFYFRNHWLFALLGSAVFVVGSVLDILDGALARAGGKGTPFGAFLDSSLDRVGEAAMLGATGLVLAKEGNDVALCFAFAAVIGSFLVSYTRAKAEILGLKGDVGFGSRAERVAIIAVGVALTPVGALQWAIYALAALAWVTVLQRILAVRSQLREQA